MSSRRLKTTLNVWSRKLHRWGSIATALPFLIVICTGMLLLLKKEIAWIQPPTATPAVEPAGPAITFEQALNAARGVPEAGVDGWDDVHRLDLRIRDGVLKVQTRSGWEVQVCAATGDVLHHAARRSDLIESIHDGTFFHARAKYLIVLPTAVIVLSLWTTGLWLWLMPYLRRSRA